MILYNSKTSNAEVDLDKDWQLERTTTGVDDIRKGHLCRSNTAHNLKCHLQKLFLKESCGPCDWVIFRKFDRKSLEIPSSLFLYRKCYSESNLFANRRRTFSSRLKSLQSEEHVEIFHKVHFIGLRIRYQSANCQFSDKLIILQAFGDTLNFRPSTVEDILNCCTQDN